MPELPEVETIRRQLEREVVAHRITTIVVHRSDVLRGDSANLHAQTLTGVRRFGKLLVLDFENGISACIHLKMTGRLTLLSSTATLPSHTHVEFYLQSGQEVRRLAFSDMRRFGYIHILPSDQVEALPFISRLGKEPLKNLSFQDFQTLLLRSARGIKTLLLDQSKIAGIGNIYACEALWIAKISPLKISKNLTSLEQKNLFSAIEEVLQEGIIRGGASDNTYRDLLGEKGRYQQFFKVYGRKGKPCSRCQSSIERVVVGGRGTWLCPNCQLHTE
ncbi:bifunctional DNA-formamidopyrimidine glycosylase/DNA-(apurinic or apyrimidinic site) lyase [Candidatus Woesebacteria bacterium]|nr:bifunctional DNA-formamidopyrimidine glycosylase/DNA-(apurinic or apyrimidinic site) lyase [Candidatus Woesebacteria bacterium]